MKYDHLGLHGWHYSANDLFVRWSMVCPMELVLCCVILPGQVSDGQHSVISPFFSNLRIGLHFDVVPSFFNIIQHLYLCKGSWDDDLRGPTSLFVVSIGVVRRIY